MGMPTIGSSAYFAWMAAQGGTPAPAPAPAPLPINTIPTAPPSPSGWTLPDSSWYIPPSYIPPNTPIFVGVPINTIPPAPSAPPAPPPTPRNTMPPMLDDVEPVELMPINTIPPAPSASTAPMPMPTNIPPAPDNPVSNPEPPANTRGRPNTLGD